MTTALIAAALLATPATKQATYSIPVETPSQKAKRMAWWSEARFGMFIHWGLYSVAAGHWNGKASNGAGEWLLNDMQIPPSEYEALRGQFNPVKFDAEKWVHIAKDAGMKYIVITTKHHDGFGLWPSKQSDWNVGFTPYQKDLLKQMAKACHDQGIRLCFYHSIMDWHSPLYLPHRAWDTRNLHNTDFDDYVKYLKAQLKELLTGYGPIGLVWFDGEWESTWTHERGKDLYAYVRSLQPNTIVNNRVDTGRTADGGNVNPGDAVGDYGTPEQTIPANGLPGQYWESCMTMNDTWGYKIDDNNWKSSTTLIKNLIDCSSKGGNYLLNVGPTGLGEIPEPSVERLAEVGKWLRKNGSAIYGSTASPFPRALPWGKATQKPGKIFLHVFETSAGTITLTGLQAMIKKVYPMGDAGHPLAVSASTDGPVVTLPSDDGEPVRVLVAEVSGPVTVAPVVLKQSSDGSITLHAIDATLTGGAQYETQNDAIGYWTNQADTVEWSFVASHAGKHNVTLEYACQPGSEGSAFQVQIGNETLTGTVASTGGWRNFQSLSLGSVDIPASGWVTVKVTATSMPGGAVMNLKSVKIEP
jgi:alpha-L-fucosidase